MTITKTKTMTMAVLLSVVCCLLSTNAVAQQRQKWGVPFFRNYAAQEYGGHNRSFDVECDTLGYVYVANFEGLLVYDHVTWHMIHTPGVSRIVCLYKDEKSARVWFGGYNVLGYVAVKGDSVQVSYLHSDEDSDIRLGEVRLIYKLADELHFVTNDNGSDHAYRVVGERIVDEGEATTISAQRRLLEKDSRLPSVSTNRDGYRIMAVAKQGLKITETNGELLTSISTDNGLCSDLITDLAYDGHGTVWGTTDNGIFSLSTSPIYSRYSDHEGLQGQVQSITEAGGTLYVGTLQGLFRLRDNRFERMGDVEQACWQLKVREDGGLYAATAGGLYCYDGGGLRQVSTRHTLSIFLREDGYLTGELDGIYDQHGTLVAKVPNVIRMESDGKGGVWAISLYNETFHMKAGSTDFLPEKNSHLTVLFDYRDDRGVHWQARSNGMGLQDEGQNPQVRPWIMPFAGLSIEAMYVSDGIAWVGGNFGLYRMNLALAMESKVTTATAYMRRFTITAEGVTCAAAINRFDPMGETVLSYRMHDDDPWSAWQKNGVVTFHNLAPGSYQLTMRLRDINGNVWTAPTQRFTIPEPWFRTWWASLTYLFIILMSSWGIYHWRLRRAERQQRKLEQIVAERTSELNIAHEKLLRQEREATVGKLTKGLIDRILNPMNYINNFSHLTRGLIKDLSEDIEDEKQNMSEDNYEDAQDVLSMMGLNLEKIEQHGLSTTRILKAMEEVLKERNRERAECDLVSICDKNVEMLTIYYAEGIKRSNVDCQWEKPSEPIVAFVNADQISKVISAMVANAVHAITKRLEKEQYRPVIGLRLEQNAEGRAQITVYDNGIGIEEGIIDKVFDPFFTTKPTAEAPGIGLYIVQQIIQDHGGSVSVHSEPMKLTEFTITL